MVFSNARLFELRSLISDGSLPRKDSTGMKFSKIDAACTGSDNSIILAFGDGQIIQISSEGSISNNESWSSRRGNVLHICYQTSRMCVVTLELSSKGPAEDDQMFLCSYFLPFSGNSPEHFSIPLPMPAANLGVCKMSGKIVIAMDSTISFFSAGSGAVPGQFEHLLEINLQGALEACGVIGSAISFVSVRGPFLAVATDSVLLVSVLAEGKSAERKASQSEYAKKKDAIFGTKQGSHRREISKQKSIGVGMTILEESDELSSFISSIPRGKVIDGDDMAACYFEGNLSTETTVALTSTCLSLLEDDFDAKSALSSNTAQQEENREAGGIWVDPWLGPLHMPITSNSSITGSASIGVCQALMIRRCNIRETIISLQMLDSESEDKKDHCTLLVGTTCNAYIYDLQGKGGKINSKTCEVMARSKITFSGGILLSITASMHYIFALTAAGLEIWTLCCTSSREKSRVDVFSDDEIMDGAELSSRYRSFLNDKESCLLSLKDLEVGGIISSSPPCFLFGMKNSLVILPGQRNEHFNLYTASQARVRFRLKEYYDEKNQTGTNAQIFNIWREQFCNYSAESKQKLPPAGLKLGFEPTLALYFRLQTAVAEFIQGTESEKGEAERIREKKESWQQLMLFIQMAKALYGMISRESERSWRAMKSAKSEICALATLNTYCTISMRKGDCASLIAGLHLSACEFSNSVYNSEGTVHQFGQACSWFLLSNTPVVSACQMLMDTAEKRKNRRVTIVEVKDVPEKKENYSRGGWFGWGTQSDLTNSIQKPTKNQQQPPPEEEDVSNLVEELQSAMLSQYLELVLLGSSLNPSHVRPPLRDSTDQSDRFEKLLGLLVDTLGHVDPSSLIRFVIRASKIPWQSCSSARTAALLALRGIQGSDESIGLAKIILSGYEFDQSESPVLLHVKPNLIEIACVAHPALLIQQTGDVNAQIRMGVLAQSAIESGAIRALIEALVQLSTPLSSAHTDILTATNMQQLLPSVVVPVLDPIQILFATRGTGSEIASRLVDKLGLKSTYPNSTAGLLSKSDRKYGNIYEMYLHARCSLDQSRQFNSNSSYASFKLIGPWKEYFESNDKLESALEEELGRIYLSNLSNASATDIENMSSLNTSDFDTLPLWMKRFCMLLCDESSNLDSSLKAATQLLMLPGSALSAISPLIKYQDMDSSGTTHSSVQFVQKVITAVHLGLGENPDAGIHYIRSCLEGQKKETFFQEQCDFLVDFMQFSCKLDATRWRKCIECLDSFGEESSSVKTAVMEYTALVLPHSTYLQSIPKNVSLLQFMASLDTSLAILCNE